MIKKCKGFGFTLNEIREILNLVDVKEATCDTMSVMVEKKLYDIDQKIKELEEVKKMITEQVEASTGVCTVAKSNVNCGVLTAVNST